MSVGYGMMAILGEVALEFVANAKWAIMIDWIRTFCYE
jgi:hypothetical protein